MNLAPPPGLEPIVRGLATLDAILSKDWESRCYSFNASWGDGQRMASMRDGSGDEWFLVFCKAGAFLKGLAHEYPRGDVKAIYDGIPTGLAEFLDEEAFTIEDTTYGGWFDGRWTLRCGPEAEQVMAEHLALLGGDPDAYGRYAKDYFELDVPRDAIAHVYANRQLDQQLVRRIADRDLGELQADLDEIGYPR